MLFAGVGGKGTSSEVSAGEPLAAFTGERRKLVACLSFYRFCNFRQSCVADGPFQWDGCFTASVCSHQDMLLNVALFHSPTLTLLCQPLMHGLGDSAAQAA